MICSWICNISRAPARPSHFRSAFVPSSIQFTIHLWKFVESHRTAFVILIIPPSFSSSYRIRCLYHTTFVTVFIPLSFCQIFSTACQSSNSKISQFSQLSQLSQNSQLSTISTNSRLSLLSLPSQKFHPSPPSPTTKCSTE